MKSGKCRKQGSEKVFYYQCYTNKTVTIWSRKGKPQVFSMDNFLKKFKIEKCD